MIREQIRNRPFERAHSDSVDDADAVVIVEVGRVQKLVGHFGSFIDRLADDIQLAADRGLLLQCN